jgi:hypothetical protein
MIKNAIKKKKRLYERLGCIKAYVLRLEEDGEACW